MTDNSPGRRAAAYWFADGLPDLVFGFTLLLWASAGFLWQVYWPHPWIFDLLLMASGGLLHFWKEREVLDFLKSRMTYPRTGYAQPPEEASPGPPSRLTSLELYPARPPKENVTDFRRRTVTAVIWVLFCVFNPGPLPWLAPAAMLALALVLYIANRDSEHPYPWWWALVLGLSGLLFFGFEIPQPLQPLLCYMIVGAWISLLGVSALVRYLQSHPSRPLAEAWKP